MPEFLFIAIMPGVKNICFHKKDFDFLQLNHVLPGKAIHFCYSYVVNYSVNLIDFIKSGQRVVIPTDTLYGIVCSALNRDAVEELYRIKNRTESKPFIILIADINDLALFSVSPEKYRALAERYWPGPVSIILPCEDKSFEYLHRSTQTLAFRLPANEELRELLRKTGPLVAPSANPEGLPPGTTIEEARVYFGDEVACYIDGDVLNGKPSTIILVGRDGSITKLR